MPSHADALSTLSCVTVVRVVKRAQELVVTIRTWLHNRVKFVEVTEQERNNVARMHSTDSKNSAVQLLNTKIVDVTLRETVIYTFCVVSSSQSIINFYSIFITQMVLSFVVVPLH